MTPYDSVLLAQVTRNLMKAVELGEPEILDLAIAAGERAKTIKIWRKHMQAIDYNELGRRTVAAVAAVDAHARAAKMALEQVDAHARAAKMALEQKAQEDAVKARASREPKAERWYVMTVYPQGFSGRFGPSEYYTYGVSGGSYAGCPGFGGYFFSTQENALDFRDDMNRALGKGAMPFFVISEEQRDRLPSAQEFCESTGWELYLDFAGMKDPSEKGIADFHKAQCQSIDGKRNQGMYEQALRGRKWWMNEHPSLRINLVPTEFPQKTDETKLPIWLVVEKNTRTGARRFHSYEASSQTFRSITDELTATRMIWAEADVVIQALRSMGFTPNSGCIISVEKDPAYAKQEDSC